MQGLVSNRHRSGMILSFNLNLLVGAIVGSLLFHFFGEGQPWWMIALMFVGPVVAMFLLELF